MMKEKADGLFVCYMWRHGRTQERSPSVSQTNVRRVVFTCTRRLHLAFLEIPHGQWTTSTPASSNGLLRKNLAQAIGPFIVKRKATGPFGQKNCDSRTRSLNHEQCTMNE